jgi:hypothetical protein
MVSLYTKPAEKSAEHFAWSSINKGKRAMLAPQLNLFILEIVCCHSFQYSGTFSYCLQDRFSFQCEALLPYFATLA